MTQIQTTDHTAPSTTSGTGPRSRTIAWGTTIAGAIALGLAVLVGLTEIAGLSIPFRTAGPGAVIVVGVLILLVGLVVVIRSGRSSAADRAGTPVQARITAPPGAHSQPAPSSAASSAPPVAGSPLDMPTDASAAHPAPRPVAAADGTPPPPAPTGSSKEDGPTQSNH